MTELQITIGHLKESISVGNVLLDKLEAKQRDLDKPKVPSFPYSFTIVKDKDLEDMFVIGLKEPNSVWKELPVGFSGRACFDRGDIRQIIKGLQTLLGDRQ